MNNKITKYRIIGDLHGRTNWHQLIEPFDENTMYVFVGDYTDPYEWEGVTFKQMIVEINKIFDFKREHPDNVVLLYGNHDLDYILGSRSTSRSERIQYRFDIICGLFADNKNLFHGVAYQVSDKYLITHAGVTYTWYTRRCEFDKDNIGKESLADVCKHINDLWFSGKDGKEKFDFQHNTSRFSDYYGDYKTHSPLWVRPWALWGDNLLGFSGDKIQIIGHTAFDDNLNDGWEDTYNRIAIFCTEKEPATSDEIDSGLYILDGLDKCKLVYNKPENINIILVDCLRRETACVDIDADTLEWKKVKIGDDVMSLEEILE